ncbi:hypothetical protein [Maledivibacter halophilus]|uniref:Uncharacterized protein n=1 Tax=Maledivibacter halophilus TaxID=36842 RepID=A0A1T5MBC4_9FIRM|nr:hypothetical protein [Maledivibacter halophilus]SKC85502.1 hypothetical protein SAMN02194393_04373 [Maledivibacter halophilus]
MEWILLFITNWVIFLLLVDWRKLKINIWSGLLAIIMAITVDFFNTINGRYIIRDSIISILGTSLFFLIGPVFVIGTLLAQYHPRKKSLTILNTIILFILYSSTELILVFRGAVEYLNWNFYDSLIINIGALSTLSWFSIVLLDKWRVEE